jgi:bacteriocin biosynthesis cyclodehydratase domain-containing protein
MPFTILSSQGTVRLVAGEDFRYTLTGPELDVWLPGWLATLDGRTLLEDLLARLPEIRRASARELAARLYAERVLIDGSAADAHVAGPWRLAIEGSAAWAADWQPDPRGETTVLGSTDRNGCAPRPLPILCQDQLDYDELLRFNRRCLGDGTPWLWGSTGAMSRGYASPLFLPDAGPCASCLLYHFRRLSPAPELYDALVEHTRSGRSLTPVPFPPPAAALLRQLLVWKAALAQGPVAPAAVYRLHVVEVATLEVTSHRVFIDPECPECSGRK